MIELLNIDCMEYMKGLPDKAFDLAIVDPPYGIDGDKGIQKNNGKFGFKKHKHTSWDSSIPTAEYFEHLFRVSKNQIIWGGNYFTEYLPPKMCWLSWDKMQTDFSFSDFELAWTSFNTKCRKFELIRGFDSKGVHYSTINGRIHPTQKPVALYKWLLHNYAKPVCSNKHTEEYKSLCTDCNKPFRILDTHLGSGSSAIAAHSMGFYFVGCELDKDYYNAACKRFKEQTMQQKLFI